MSCEWDEEPSIYPPCNPDLLSDWAVISVDERPLSKNNSSNGLFGRFGYPGVNQLVEYDPAYARFIRRKIEWMNICYNEDSLDGAVRLRTLTDDFDYQFITAQLGERPEHDLLHNALSALKKDYEQFPLAILHGLN